ncbi:MAG: diguanylate cyclase [Clostridiales bacterium]|nr:diguanylate cyclase [Clostridiales bacterium]
MDEEKILLLIKNAAEADLFVNLCRDIGPVLVSSSLEEAAFLASHARVHILIIDQAQADYSNFKSFITPKTSIIITGRDEKAAHQMMDRWPEDYFIDFLPAPAEESAKERSARILQIAAQHARLKLELEKLASAREEDQEKIEKVYSEIKEIKSFINNNIVTELEKRITLQVRYLWFQKRKQKIEDIIRKIYMANDVSSLLDTVSDIKDLIQADGVTFYILDENETLGKYLKPLVWDDAFLSHSDFSKYIALLDSHDFAAQVVRQKDDINLAAIPQDKRLPKRYVEHIKRPLRSILCVPIRHEEEIIGVLEATNKLHKGELSKHGFSRDDLQVLRGISEHISLAMTKLNLIQYDALTGLLRPDPFFEKVIQKINLQSKRRQEMGAFAMVMGDVDWFKHYNDRNGHEAGNRLLRQLAAVLKSSIREDDLLCRYGGEEFLFFLTGITSLDEACILTDRIRKNVEEEYFENEEFQPRSNLTMSFGVTLLPKKDDFYAAVNRYELKKIAIEADMALAEAKGKRFAHPRKPGEEEKELNKNKVCAFHRELADREKRAGVVRPYREEFFEEKRKHRRHYVSTLLLYADNGQFRATKTINLSLGGLRMYTEARLPTARTIDFLLVLENKATPLKGDVVYSQKASERSPFFSTGLKFKEMSPVDGKALENYLASLPKGMV